MKISKVTDGEWDTFISSHRDGFHEQSSQYCRLREEWNFRSHRIAVCDSGAVIGGMQVLSRSTPVGRGACIMGGPIVIDDRSDVYHLILKELDLLANRQSFAWVRANLLPHQQAAHTALSKGNFYSSKKWAGVQDSQIVPLAESDSEILSRMKPKGRYNVRLAQRSGVEVRPMNVDSIDQFYDLYRQTATHQGFPFYSRNYFDYLWQKFNPESKIILLIAYLKNVPVAGIINLLSGNRTYYCWGGMSRLPEHRKLMANYLLHFNAMSISRSHGCTHYDLIGSSSFKDKLGGETVKWPSSQWKYYGPFKTIRRHGMEMSWRNMCLRRVVKSISWRQFKPMPN